jgi:hypothetical protein
MGRGGPTGRRTCVCRDAPACRTGYRSCPAPSRASLSGHGHLVLSLCRRRRHRGRPARPPRRARRHRPSPQGRCGPYPKPNPRHDRDHDHDGGSVGRGFRGLFYRAGGGTCARAACDVRRRGGGRAGQFACPANLPRPAGARAQGARPGRYLWCAPLPPLLYATGNCARASLDACHACFSLSLCLSLCVHVCRSCVYAFLCLCVCVSDAGAQRTGGPHGCR